MGLKKYPLKTTFISLLSLLCYLKSSAQSNFYKLSLGAGYGVTKSFTGVQSHDSGLAASGNADFFFTPFLSLGGELQMGEIKGHDFNSQPYPRDFVNSYKSAAINGKLFLGALIDNNGRSPFINTIRWLYAGAGVGAIHNNMTRIERGRKNTPSYFPGQDFSNDLLIPMNLGINVYVSNTYGIPRLAINVNYQANVTVGEGLDGYDSSIVTLRSEKHPDIYSYFSIGLKYHIGLIGLSRRSLYY